MRSEFRSILQKSHLYRRVVVASWEHHFVFQCTNILPLNRVYLRLVSNGCVVFRDQKKHFLSHFKKSFFFLIEIFVCFPTTDFIYICAADFFSINTLFIHSIFNFFGTLQTMKFFVCYLRLKKKSFS